MGVLSACVYRCTMCLQCLWWPQEGIRTHGIGVSDGWELPCGYLELNPGPLREQLVLLKQRLIFPTSQDDFSCGNDPLHLHSIVMRCFDPSVACWEKTSVWPGSVSTRLLPGWWKSGFKFRTSLTDAVEVLDSHRTVMVYQGLCHL